MEKLKYVYIGKDDDHTWWLAQSENNDPVFDETIQIIGKAPEELKKFFRKDFVNFISNISDVSPHLFYFNLFGNLCGVSASKKNFDISALSQEDRLQFV